MKGYDRNRIVSDADWGVIEDLSKRIKAVQRPTVANVIDIERISEMLQFSEPVRLEIEECHRAIRATLAEATRPTFDFWKSVDISNWGRIPDVSSLFPKIDIANSNFLKASKLLQGQQDILRAGKAVASQFSWIGSTVLGSLADWHSNLQLERWASTARLSELDIPYLTAGSAAGYSRSEIPVDVSRAAYISTLCADRRVVAGLYLGGANDSFCVPGWVWYPVKQRWVKVDWPCEYEGTICVEIRNWRKGMGR